MSAPVSPATAPFTRILGGHSGGEPVQPCRPGGEQGGAVLGHLGAAAVQADHQRIRGGTGLEHIQLPFHLVGGDERTVQMQQGGLGQAGQGLVGALDDQGGLFESH